MWLRRGQQCRAYEAGCARRRCAVFFASRERLIPGRIFVQLFGEVFQTNELERPGDILGFFALGRVRVRCDPSECADGDVRPLGQQELLGVSFDLNRPAPPRPKASNCPYQGALARTGIAGNQNTLARHVRQSHLRRLCHRSIEPTGF
jgi:hypothetical protein